MAKEKDWTFKPDGDYHRRVVPSPKPKRIFEMRQIRWLLEKGAIVICAGGGGIPVMYTDPDGPALSGPDKELVGVEAVIDKDFASGLLASGIDADMFVMATDADAVYDGCGEPGQRAIARANPSDAPAECPLRGRFDAPKVQAACEFAESTGGSAAIGGLGDIRRCSPARLEPSSRSTRRRSPTVPAQRGSPPERNHRHPSPQENPMAVNLRDRSFLKELDFSPAELRFLLELSSDLKAAKQRRHRSDQRLKGKNIALHLREDLDADALRLRGGLVRPGRPRHLPRPRELARWATRNRPRTPRECWVATTTRSSTAARARPTVETLAEFSGVPVYNGLTDEWHPTQMLADFLTMGEASGKEYSELSYAFMGDLRFNMGRSLLVMGALTGQ